MKEYNKTDVFVSLISLGLITIWLLLCVSIKILAIVLLVVSILFVILIFFAIFSTFNSPEMNNGKEGYYAQYGESFGSNAHKHEQYKKKQEQFIEEQIANKIMK